MDFEFINNIRIALENQNVFQYTIIGSKACAIGLLFFSILEKWTKNLIGNSNSYSDLLQILGFVALIVCSDWIFDLLENTFSSINSVMGNVEDDMYTDLLSTVSEDYIMITDGAHDWMDMISVVLSNLTFFIGFIFVLLLSGIVKIADMSMVCGFLLSRIFLLDVMKFLFPIAVAFSSLKQTSGLLGKWIKMYVGLSLLGIVYIGILGFCSITTTALQNSFREVGNGGFFDGYLNMNSSVWGALITIIIAFSLKVTLFNKATSFITNYFS